MNPFKHAAAWMWVCTLLMVGCANHGPVLAGDALFRDALFAPPPAGIDAEAAFALSPAMRRYADTVLQPLMLGNNPERALIEALQDKGLLQLEYDASTTRTAASAFEARAGNCLSLVLMTGAFAEYFGFEVHYQEVFVQPSWSRSGALEMASRHINLRLVPHDASLGVNTGQGAVLQRSRGGPGGGFTVDFLPPETAALHLAREISHDTVKAMFLNNRAAELLADGQVDAAYWWVRESIRDVPAFSDAYNLLGVIYQHHGNPAQAESVLRHALALEPDKTLVMSNLAGLLEHNGALEEAQQLRARIALIAPYPPFYFFDAGVTALKAGQYATARTLFGREIKRDAGSAECYFGLALADLGLGETDAARVALAEARERSTTRQSRAIYSAKLDWLKANGYSRGSHPRGGDG
jgi:Tfp pilus assembly protein PilF